LVYWIRNTWRKEKTNSPSLKQYKLTDVLWWTEPEKVLKEIAILMKRDYVDTTTDGWFPLRTAATKRIIDNMTVAEKTKLEMKAQEFAEKGLPVELQRK
jgi:hypothetical protein